MTPTDDHTLEYSKFVVGNKPCCIWEWDLKEKNLKFLDRVIPDYFEYIVNQNIPLLEGEENITPR